MAAIALGLLAVASTAHAFAPARNRNFHHPRRAPPRQLRGKRISGRDLVAMGHMKCGQPPDVRDCRPDDVAARLHTECAGWYGAVCELLRNLLRQPPRHRADAVIFDFPTGTRRTPSSVSPTRTAYQCSTRLLIEASTSARRRGATRSFEPLRGAGAY